LMHEMHKEASGTGSAWGPWLALLPSASEAGALDLPLFWSKDEEAVLLEKCSTRRIAELTAEAEDDFEWLEAEIFAKDRSAYPESSFGRDQWTRCLALALSRSFFVSGATRLAPLVDFANHSPDATVEVGGGGGGGGALGAMVGSLASKMAGAQSGMGGVVQLTADRSYEAGDEVCCSYGARSGGAYLEEYGMGVSSSRSSGIAELVLDLVTDSPRCNSDKEDVLEEAGLDVTAMFEVSDALGGEPDPALVQMARLLVLDASDLFLLEPVFRNEVMDFMGLPVSEPNELQVGSLIMAKCRAELDRIGVTLLAGDQGVGGPSDDSDTAARHRAVAEQVRVGEAAALEASVRWWKRDAELVHLKEFYQERRLKDLNLDKPWSPEEGGEFGVESSFSVGRAPGNADWS